MCGIVGYIGQRDVGPILLGGRHLSQIHHADQDRRKAVARCVIVGSGKNGTDPGFK
ncbi:MAG: hypothetical protein QGI34_11525 [Candidatus Latescibacteria bacterium]|jgi:hypothetical protein|nr:hypothetical protein [Candidatus Latescibacterota bacterium]